MKTTLFIFLVFIGIFNYSYTQTWNMVANQTTTINACVGTIYDAGGPGGNYANNEITTFTINSGSPGLGASVTFTSFNLQLDFDYLYIYAGSDNTGALLATLTGNGIPAPATYTSTNSSITLYLVSSNSITKAGFAATISCDTIPLCNDGIQNGLEEGIDCGGCTSCPPCVSVPQISNATSSAFANTYLLPCIGGTVNLSAIGQNSIPVLASNFNDGTPGVGWNFVGSGMFDNPCGESPNGTTHLWFGASSPHPRTLTTNELNLPCGGQICFDLKFAIQGGSGDCEGPDLPNEGVSLMYSTDCGVTFAPIAYFHPDGNIESYNPMTTTFSTFGATPFTDWANYCFNLPPEAFSDHTIIRWHQEETSGAGFDHWGLDEVLITATNCTPYYFDWAHIPGYPDPANVTAFITETTTFDVIYTNGVNDTIPSQITVVVDEIFNSTITTISETCMTYTNGIATFTGNGSTGPYTFTVDGPNGFHQTYTGNPTVTATNLPSGNFTLTTSTANICSIVDTFSIQQGYPLPEFTFLPLVPHLCFNDPEITLSANVSDGLPAYTYLWSTGETIPTIQASGGVYTLTVTDSRNCSSPTQSVTVNQDAQPILANAGPDLNICKQYSNSINVQGSIQTASGGLWSGGNGVYSPSNSILNLFYTPTNNELNQGYVDLILTSTGNNGCPGSVDTVRINFFVFNEVIDLTTTNITCNGINNGQASVSTIGAYSPCTFSWDGALPTAVNSVTNLAPGIHFVRIINAIGCDTTLSFTLTEPTILNLSISPNSAHLCFGDPNILITSTVSGGTPPYIYSWNTGENTPNLSAGVGTHVLNVTDQFGCGPFSQTAIFTQDLMPIQANAGQDKKVCRQNPGTINVLATVQTATGGIWSGGLGTYSPNNTSLNLNYTPTLAEISNGFVDLTLTTTGNNNCPPASDVVRIFFLSFDENITLSTVDISCFGFNNGQANVTCTGSYSPATFSWDNGSITASNSIMNLTAGIHSVRIINSMGCDTTLSFVINQPQALVLSVGPSNTHLCFGDAPVLISSSMSGGTAPYIYTWSNGQNTTNITVGAGNYTLSVTDQHNCPSVSQSAIVNQDVLPIIANAGVDKYVCRQNPGTINVIGTVQTATGGIWSGGGGLLTPNNTSLNLFYTPTAAEISSGFVDLTLTSTGNNNCPPSIDVVRIYFMSFNETLTLTTTNITCNGVNNGTATVISSGLYSPATFSWDNGSITAVGFKNNLTPGLHEVRIINSMGCDTTLFFTLTQPQPLTVSVSPTSLHLCFGEDPITITSSVQGGTSPYHYSWNNGATTENVIGGAGAYILTIIDNNNCPPVSATSLITQDLLPILVNAGSDVNVCRQNPGMIALHGTVQTATGGIWTGGSGLFSTSNTALNVFYTPTASEISNGFLDLSLISTGNNNCPADTDVVRITFYSFNENIILNTTNISCKGYNNGHATITTNGIFSPSTFSWDNTTPTTVNTQLSLTPGLHQIRIINSMGCDTILFFTIQEPAILNPQLAQTTSNICYGQTNGLAVINVTGGTEPYQYLWNTNPPQTGDSAVNLPGGSYLCTVTDINSCQTMLAVNIVEPQELLLNFAAVNPSCHGLVNGAISVNVTGGTLPYVYNWSTGETSTMLSNIGAGSYTLNISDAHGCTIQNSQIITEPPLLVANISDDTTICPGDSVFISVLAIGGTGSYSYTWNPGGAQTSSIIVNPISNQTFTCQIHDVNNCALNLTSHVKVNLLDNMDIMPILSTTEICKNDSVILSVDYLGNDPNVTLTWLFCPTCSTNTPITLFPIESTFYTVEAVNSCGNSILDSIQVLVHQIPNIVLTPIIDSICPHSVVFFSNLGDNSNAWSYTWNFGDSTYGSGMHPSHQYDESGSYMVNLSIIDNNGCKAQNIDTSIIVVNPPAQPAFTISSYSQDLINPLFEFSNNSSISNSYVWKFGDGNTSAEISPSHSYEIYGHYVITLIADNQYGCPDSVTHDINISASWAIYAPNTFTPDGDNINEVFYLKGYGIKDKNFTLLIYNRWGQVINETHNINDGWNGTRPDETKICQDGVYIWVVFFEDQTGDLHRKEGHVVLLK
ncbi:MAG: gliding motility-associated C-terminal domain-containing protein [Flavobacteriia bacterium]|nr:gliding motility-associated C-terminal domain-containing protein [Flavobacteriia bacterium]